MSKNILVKLGGVNVTAYLRSAKKTETYGDAVAKYDFELTKNVSNAVAISNALTCEVWLDSNVPPTTKVFDGYIDLFEPKAGIVNVTAKDKLAYLINKQVMHYYDSDISGDAAYPIGKISNIFADLVVTYGGLTAISSVLGGLALTVQDSGTELCLSKFPCRNADIFERCRKLAETLNWVFYYKTSEDKVFFEPKNFSTNPTSLEVGINIIEVPTWEYDRAEMINDLRLEGAQQLVQGAEVFSGNASTVDFVLSTIPEDVAVYYSAAKDYSTTAKLPGEIQIGDMLNSLATHDYEVDKKNKTITFTSFTPANSANNILVESSYYAPIPIHMENNGSKAVYGVYAKTVTLTDVVTLDDAWKRAENILNKYSQPFKSAKIKAKWTSGLDIHVGQKICVVDDINTPAVNQYFTVYKTIDYYPENIVEIEVGDKQYTIDEYQANIVERVKRLEETVIGATDNSTEIVQNTLLFDFVPESTTITAFNIVDSFILGQKTNAILGTTKLGWRGTLSSTVTYTW